MSETPKRQKLADLRPGMTTEEIFSLPHEKFMALMDELGDANAAWLAKFND